MTNERKRRAELFALIKKPGSVGRPSSQPRPLALARNAHRLRGAGRQTKFPNEKTGTGWASPGARVGARAGARAGGGERNRTVDLLLAKQALSQLSYTPFRSQKSDFRSQAMTMATKCYPTSVFWFLYSDLVGRGGLEPPTSRLSSARSNQLSYQPDSEVRYQQSDVSDL